MSGLPPAGVLFDAGGTLVQLHAERLADELRERGHDPHELDDAFWHTLVLLDEEFGPSAGVWTDWFPRWLGKVAERCRVPHEVMADAWAAADAEAILWDHPIDGAKDCLIRLRMDGVRVGVVSNSDGRIQEGLERAGLLDLLEVVIDSGTIGVEKPDPAIFTHAMEPLGLTPETTWYLGDTVQYDAAAADAAGLTSWVFDHKGLHTVAHPRRVHDLLGFADQVIAARRAG